MGHFFVPTLLPTHFFQQSDSEVSFKVASEFSLLLFSGFFFFW